MLIALPAVFTENKIPTASEIKDLRNRCLHFRCIYRETADPPMKSAGWAGFPRRFENPAPPD
jgi:hypothetical protein